MVMLVAQQELTVPEGRAIGLASLPPHRLLVDSHPQLAPVDMEAECLAQAPLLQHSNRSLRREPQGLDSAYMKHRRSFKSWQSWQRGPPCSMIQL